MTDTSQAPGAPRDPIANVSLVIHQTVRQGAVERYEAWLREISHKAAQYPGHQGVHIIRPAAGGYTYTIVIRFATVEDASRWTTSADRQALVAQIADALETRETLDIQPGIDFWFTPPPGAPHKARPWKQWLITTSVIWPLTMVVPIVVKPLFQAVPALGVFGVSNLIVAAIIVALVTWVIMPRYVRLVSGWLFH
jgi:antibiotic biosynthesis monooxygenase (ABM) superfamily enzyme